MGVPLLQRLVYCTHMAALRRIGLVAKTNMALAVTGTGRVHRSEGAGSALVGRNVGLAAEGSAPWHGDMATCQQDVLALRERLAKAVQN